MKTYDAEVCEWGNELVRVVPFIYELFLQNKNIKIETTKGMRPFYYFLKDEQVIIKYKNRYHMKGIYSKDIPSQNLYDNHLDYEYWTPPPYKHHFNSQKIVYPENKLNPQKKTLIISNKYNKEWAWEGINAIPLEVLDKLFNSLKESHNIIYNRLNPKYFVIDDDTLPFDSFDDASILQKHPEVIDVNEVYELNTDMDISTFQLILFSHASKFINVQGGLGHFASFFGGKQLFYLERNGHRNIENHRLKNLQAWHTKMGGAEIQKVDKSNIFEYIDWLTN
jgi:hypothetical protein|tara:strand:- start:5439 stop:6278 length:840 start_codon:yes stop_codon:yes gene_type:complete